VRQGGREYIERGKSREKRREDERGGKRAAAREIYERDDTIRERSETLEREHGEKESDRQLEEWKKERGEGHTTKRVRSAAGSHDRPHSK